MCCVVYYLLRNYAFSITFKLYIVVYALKWIHTYLVINSVSSSSVCIRKRESVYKRVIHQGNATKEVAISVG